MNKQVSAYVVATVFLLLGLAIGFHAARYYYFEYAQMIATEALNIVLEVKRMCTPGEFEVEKRKQLTKS